MHHCETKSLHLPVNSISFPDLKCLFPLSVPNLAKQQAFLLGKVLLLHRFARLVPHCIMGNGQFSARTGPHFFTLSSFYKCRATQPSWQNIELLASSSSHNFKKMPWEVLESIYEQAFRSLQVTVKMCTIFLQYLNLK
jgi:hypothetical protein